MSSRREQRRTTFAACVAASAAAVVTALAACSGGVPDPSALPSDAPAAVTATGAPSAVEVPAVTPTRASTGLETPLPTSAPKAAVLLAAAATGTATPPPEGEHPGVECVYFQWHPDGPTTPPGVTFVVDHAKVSPRVWKPVKVDCQGAVCARAVLTSTEGSCAIALARDDGPHATGPTGAVVRLVGSVRCRAPATHAQCTAFTDALRAFAKRSDSGLPLDVPTTGDGSGDGSGGSGSTDDSGSTAGTGDSGTTGDGPSTSPTGG